jgi:hypothetical protein
MRLLLLQHLTHKCAKRRLVAYLHLCAGNRWDNFYPVWARAEHRWYPTGRFATYNQYVKENIGQLTMKYAPGVSSQSQLSFELSFQYTVLYGVC